jgi:hypothetical protein
MLPAPDDREVVLDALVVDIVARLKRGHFDLGIANAGCCRGECPSEGSPDSMA